MIQISWWGSDPCSLQKPWVCPGVRKPDYLLLLSNQGYFWILIDEGGCAGLPWAPLNDLLIRRMTSKHCGDRDRGMAMVLRGLWVILHIRRLRRSFPWANGSSEPTRSLYVSFGTFLCLKYEINIFSLFSICTNKYGNLVTILTSFL